VGLAHTGTSEAPAASTVLAAPLQLETVVPEEVPHFNVEIRDTANRRLVTAIEILSPWNKRGTGRRKYLVRRRRLLSSSAHLMEIDLLRAGRRVPMRKPLPEAAYFVLCSRVQNRPLTDVWPIQIDERLPTVRVPLLHGDPDVALDLQSALNVIYDSVGYDLAINYRKPPDTPFTPDEEKRMQPFFIQVRHQASE
jgi:hypothetical protein